MPKPRGNQISTHFSVDANYAADKMTRRYHIGILLFFNQALDNWHSKRQNRVKALTFRSEFIVLKNAIELIVSLIYKV